MSEEAKAPVSPELAAPFVRAVEETFEKMLGCPVSVGRVVEASPPSPHDVSAVVGFGGDRKGAVVLSFSAHVACRVVSRFAGEQLDEVGPTVADGVGEIANIVAGRAKNAIGAAGAAPSVIAMSLPTVVCGKEHEVHRLRDSPTLLLPFTSELGDFEVVIVLAQPQDRPLRVLVADDSRVMRKLVRAACKELAANVEIIEAESGVRARESLRAAGLAFDLVILDLHMPDGSGADVLAELRAQKGGAELPVIVASSDPDVGRVVADVCARSGGATCTRSLEKPFTPQDLLDLARSMNCLRGASATPS
ncbi:chemotaxis protein CheX [bacterium]|nr:chemotaxis protein CheX [bacterium]